MTNTPGEQPDQSGGTPTPDSDAYGAPEPQGYWQQQAQGQPGQWAPPPSYGQPGQYGAPPPPYGYAATPPNDGQAVAAMVIGIVGLVGMCFYGAGTIISPVALFLGRSSMKRIAASGGQLGGRGMAQAGFVLGIIGTILLVLALAFWAIIIGLGVSGAFDDY